MSAASALSSFPIEQGPRRGSSSPLAPESVSEKVRVGGSATIRIVARSMYPWVRPGDQVFVRRYDFAQIRPGDVIFYERANRLFVHRVVQRITRPVLGGTASFLLIKGDARDRSDAPVSAKEFVGRAIRIHRGKHHIDLESFSQSVLGKILAKAAGWTRFIYRPLRSGLGAAE
ncbi:MAG TPA: S26 family signal peptidase [Candidatus Acidoferrales bacterium]